MRYLNNPKDALRSLPSYKIAKDATLNLPTQIRHLLINLQSDYVVISSISGYLEHISQIIFLHPKSNYPSIIRGPATPKRIKINHQNSKTGVAPRNIGFPYVFSVTHQLNRRSFGTRTCLLRHQARELVLVVGDSLYV